MKRCKHSSQYNGIKEPLCRLYEDGPCDSCKEQFKKVCKHPSIDLVKKDATIICSRCDSDLGMSIDLLWETVLEMRKEIAEIRWDMRPNYDD